MHIRHVTETQPHPHHGVRATVAQVKPEIRAELLNVGITAALQSGQPIRVLGIRQGGDYASCSLPDCPLDADAPQVIPPLAEVELAANGWTPPADAARLRLRAGPLRLACSVLVIGWPPSMFKERP